MATVEEILDTEIPRPTWALRPGYKAPLPEGMTHSRPSAARTLDPASGLYTSVPSGEKRIFGPQQGLLVEAAARTNHVLQSADISSWNLTGGASGVTVSSATSLIDNETAHEVTGGGASGDFAFQDAGSFSGSTEITHIHVGRGTSDLIALGVQNASTGNPVAVVEYDWANDATAVVSGSVAADYIRVLADNDGNGGEAIHFILRIGGGNGENTSGENRQIRVYPDRNGNGNGVFFHHAQIEEDLNASLPIVTGSSAVTRSGDDYSIPVGDWFSRNAGTFIFHAEPRFFDQYGGQHVIEGDGINERTYIKFTIPTGVVSVEDGNTSLQQSGLEHYSKNKIAASFDSDNRRLSVNGSSSEAGHSGNLLSPGTDIEIGALNSTIFTIEKLIYIPRLLSESTLNTLTS